MVFPFTVPLGGVEFTVSVRILLRRDDIGAGKAARIAVDIAGTERRWLFVLEKPNSPEAKTRVFIGPPPSGSLKRLAVELEETLGPLGGKISLEGSPGPDMAESWFMDAAGGQFIPVDEEA
jgi:hypothetical protein